MVKKHTQDRRPSKTVKRKSTSNKSPLQGKGHKSVKPARSSSKRTTGPTSERPPAEQDRSNEKSFLIVGIGASAGGLEAFTKLLAHLPPHTGMAFVLVQHLAPTKDSILAELLSKATSLPVREVQDGMTVEPDQVYVIPPNTALAVFHGVLRLLPRAETHAQHMPVDSFFRSLAEDQGQNAVGIILSGTGSDGSQGIRAIKAEGGIVLAQDESAKYDGMPKNAVATGSVDYVLSPEKIAAELVRISRHPFLTLHPAIKTGPRRRAEEDRDKTYLDHMYALSSVKKLAGMLPICSSCKKYAMMTGIGNRSIPISASLPRRNSAMASARIARQNYTA